MDPEAIERERNRLAERYAAATDEELQRLADQAYSLTDIATTALAKEMERRRLKFELRTDPTIGEPAEKLVTIRKFTNVVDALLAKTVLDSAQIKSFLFDENTVRMDWFYSNAVGGVKLSVLGEDAAAATELLNQKAPENFVTDDEVVFEQPRCPRCNSTDISFGEDGKRLSYATVAVGVPLPVKRGGWKCHSCGHQWDDLEETEDH